MCHVRDWDLSFECLQSRKAWEALQELRAADPIFSKELEKGKGAWLPTEDEVVAEDQIPDTEDDDTDDSDVLIKTLNQAVVNRDLVSGVVEHSPGVLMSVRDAEDIEVVAGDVMGGETGTGEVGNEHVLKKKAKAKAEPEEHGHRKQKRVPNPKYASFWWHYDSDASDIE